jgi:hypothetical protein
MTQFRIAALAGAASPPWPRLWTPYTHQRSLLFRLAASALIAVSLTVPVDAYDIQYRQNGSSFSASELRRIFSNALPAAYDQRFPDQRWTTYLLLDAHADRALVAHHLGLSPRVGPSQPLLPVATFSMIEPLPRSANQWQQLLFGPGFAMSASCSRTAAASSASRDGCVAIAQTRQCTGCVGALYPLGGG